MLPRVAPPRSLELVLPPGQRPLERREPVAHVEGNAEVPEAHAGRVERFEQVVRAALFAHLTDAHDVDAQCDMYARTSGALTDGGTRTAMTEFKRWTCGTNSSRPIASSPSCSDSELMRWRSCRARSPSSETSRSASCSARMPGTGAV
jgi:hypothetical protein